MVTFIPKYVQLASAGMDRYRFKLICGFAGEYGEGRVCNRADGIFMAMIKMIALDGFLGGLVVQVTDS